jgi:hypothetical protein
MPCADPGRGFGVLDAQKLAADRAERRANRHLKWESVLPSGSDIGGLSPNVRFVPIVLKKSVAQLFGMLEGTGRA